MTGAAGLLPNLRALKEWPDGDRVSFRARVLRLWEAGGLRMCLAGDESALTRVEIAQAVVEEGRSYEFRDAVVREYPGGWHSASLAAGGTAARLPEQVPVSQGEEYIERTFKILSGIQIKKAWREGRVAPWRHPAGDR